MMLEQLKDERGSESCFALTKATPASAVGIRNLCEGGRCKTPSRSAYKGRLALTVRNRPRFSLRGPDAKPASLPSRRGWDRVEWGGGRQRAREDTS